MFQLAKIKLNRPYRNRKQQGTGSLKRTESVTISLVSKLPINKKQMLEILEIKKHLLAGEIEEALLIVEELEEMGRQSEIRNLESFLVIFLIHLIKIQVEKRLTSSWKSSIINSLLAIQKRNKLSKKAHYIYSQDWQEYLEDNFTPAIVSASREVFGGIDYAELKAKFDRASLFNFANSLLQLTYSNNQDELVTEVENKLREFCCLQEG